MLDFILDMTVQLFFKENNYTIIDIFCIRYDIKVKSNIHYILRKRNMNKYFSDAYSITESALVNAVKDSPNYNNRKI